MKSGRFSKLSLDGKVKIKPDANPYPRFLTSAEFANNGEKK